MQKTCKECKTEFVITSEDLVFLKKISPVINGEKFEIPHPQICPKCRMQRRMAFRNQSSLYKRKCDASGKSIISMYRSDAHFPVYSPDEWFKDTWHGTDYGQDFDFNRPFFEQFIELSNKVPHLSLIWKNNINCDYCNVVGDSKNCYLIYGSVECEDCYYGNPYNCKQCVDSFLLRNSELCLECTDSNKLYNCCHCQNCANSHDLMFCCNVNNSQNCFGCASINRKEYCIFNKQYSKEDYEEQIGKMDLKDDKQAQEIKEKFEEIKSSVPHRSYIGISNENVSGNYIFNSKDCHNVYGVEECRDVSHCFQLQKVNDAMDLTVGECGELLYEVSAFYDRCVNVIFSFFFWATAHDLMYSGYCTQNVRNCFGCISLRSAEYCILNKKYSKEDYEKLVPKIIKHMEKTGEWGQFFPMDVSPFAYNETIASEFYPLEAKEVENNGWKWLDKLQSPKDVPGNATICEVTGEAFKIIPQEQKMYEHFHLSLPKRSPKQRYIDRISLRNSMHLNSRECSKCNKKMETTYDVESDKRILCEECYTKEVY